MTTKKATKFFLEGKKFLKFSGFIYASMKYREQKSTSAFLRCRSNQNSQFKHLQDEWISGILMYIRILHLSLHLIKKEKWGGEGNGVLGIFALKIRVLLYKFYMHER